MLFIVGGRSEWRAEWRSGAQGSRATARHHQMATSKPPALSKTTGSLTVSQMVPTAGQVYSARVRAGSGAVVDEAVEGVDRIHGEQAADQGAGRVVGVRCPVSGGRAQVAVGPEERIGHRGVHVDRSGSRHDDHLTCGALDPSVDVGSRRGHVDGRPRRWCGRGLVRLLGFGGLGAGPITVQEEEGEEGPADDEERQDDDEHDEPWCPAPPPATRFVGLVVDGMARFGRRRRRRRARGFGAGRRLGGGRGNGGRGCGRGSGGRGCGRGSGGRGCDRRSGGRRSGGRGCRRGLLRRCRVARDILADDRDQRDWDVPGVRREGVGTGCVGIRRRRRDGSGSRQRPQRAAAPRAAPAASARLRTAVRRPRGGTARG